MYQLKGAFWPLFCLHFGRFIFSTKDNFMKRAKILCPLLGLMLAFGTAEGQVGEVRKDARANKESTKSNNNGDRHSGESSAFMGRLFIDAFRISFRGIGLAHHKMLDRRFDQPWIVSLDASMPIGYHFPHHTKFIAPEITGKWGLFATNARINRIWDRTGNFQTVDWQILQVNFATSAHFSLRAGVGISVDTEFNQAYPEFTINSGIHFQERSLNTLLEYRVSHDPENGATPRREFSIKQEKLLATTGPFNFGGFGGFTFQRWFSNTNFYFIQAGMSIHLR